MPDSNTRDEPIDIAIIGAGIGGTAAAVALEQAGFVVHLFEQAAEWGEVGGAIVIREPSMALFEQWGVLARLRPAMVAVTRIERRDRLGAILGSVPISFDASQPDSAYCVHRADIHEALMSKVARQRLHLGHRLVSIGNSPDHAEATFANGRRIEARLIVGADGLRSVVRTLLDATPMTFIKMVAHRTIAPASLLPADMPNDRIRMWEEGQLRMIVLPMRSGTEVALSATIPALAPPQDLWGATSADEILALYANFDPLITRLIRSRSVDITTHPIYDKDPIAQWADGHVVLLGDAAHPMAPMNGQGANQALEDAGALAAALCGTRRDDRAAALIEYQAARAPVTARMQALSRKPPQMSIRSTDA